MPTDLLNAVSGDVMLGLAQAAGAIALCTAVVALCGWFSVHVGREAAISIARGLVQMGSSGRCWRPCCRARSSSARSSWWP